MSEEHLKNNEGTCIQYRLIIIMASGSTIHSSDLTFPTTQAAQSFTVSMKQNLGFGYVSRIFKETLKFGVRVNYEELQN